jgi:hypothetical protein
MTDDDVPDLVAALMILADHNVPPDVQELLLYGNPSRSIPPGALQAVLSNAKGRSDGGT